MVDLFRAIKCTPDVIAAVKARKVTGRILSFMATFEELSEVQIVLPTKAEARMLFHTIQEHKSIPGLAAGLIEGQRTADRIERERVEREAQLEREIIEKKAQLERERIKREALAVEEARNKKLADDAAAKVTPSLRTYVRPGCAITIRVCMIIITYKQQVLADAAAVERAVVLQASVDLFINVVYTVVLILNVSLD